VNEKAIASALEPVVDSLIELESRVESISKAAGPQGEAGKDGRDADPQDVAAILIKDHADVLRGAPGKDGKDAEPVDVDLVAKALAETYADTLKGQDGKDAEPVDVDLVAKALVENHADTLKGQDGKDAEPVDVELVAKALVENHADTLKGQDGKDADPVDVELVAKALAETYADTLRGSDGKDAEPVDVELVAKTLSTDYADALRGEKGADGVGIMAKQWEPGVYREGTIVQHDIGRFSIALKDTASEPWASDDWQRIGTGGFRFCGLKREGREYQVGDIFIDDGSCFMQTEKKPRMIVQKGKPGEKGEKGDRGEKGDSAPDIIGVEFDANGNLVIIKSDGNIIEVKGLALKESMKAYAETFVEVQKRLNIIDQMIADYQDIDIPVREYRGLWKRSTAYKKGALVTYDGSLWLATKDTSGAALTHVDWVQLAGKGGSGGTGRKAPAASPFNVVATPALIPAQGAGDGDTYFAFSDKLLRVWDAGTNRWRVLSGFQVANTAANLPANGQAGDVFLTADDHAMNFWIGGQWVKNLDGAYTAASAAEQALIQPQPNGRLLFRSDIPEVFVADQGAWVSTIGGSPVRVVANLAAMNLITNPNVGDLAYRQDIGELFVYDNGQWNAAEHVLHVYNDETARLAAASVFDNSFGFQRDTSALYIRDNNAWVEIGGSGAGVSSVNNQAARYNLVPAQVPLGGLVYQADTGVLWEYTGPSPATAATIAAPGSWTQITSVGATPKVIEIANPAALPSAQAAASDSSQPLYLIRQDALGNPLNRLVWFENTTPAAPGSPASGNWLNVNTENFVKDLVADQDIAGNRREGDFQATIEPDHAQLKVFANGTWQMLFNEDEIRSWIAAGSLFQGTVMNPPVVGGATDFAQLPAPATNWKGYYWTWVGSPNYQVNDGAPIQADPNYHAITYTLNPAVLPAAANTPVTVTIDVAGGGAVGIAHSVTVTITTAGNANAGSKHVVANLADTDTANDVAAKLEAEWRDGDVGLDVTVNNNVLTLTPTDATILVQAITPLPDGATPVIGVDLDGETLQVGDWLQVVTDPNGGYRWAHVPSDLLSKLRGDNLYSLQPWAAGTWERNSVVSHDCRIWRAMRGVSAQDPAPQLTGVPITILGQALINYPDSVADVNAWFVASPSNGAHSGEYIVINANGGGTYTLPGGGSMTAVSGDAILNLGNELLGTEGYAVVPGPFAVGVTPAAIIRATPRTSATNPTGGIPIPSGARLQQQFGATNVPGQRLVITADFVVPPGLPLAGTRLSAGDTIWFTDDLANGDEGWVHVTGAALGANDQPPFVPDTAVQHHITSAAVGQSALDLLLQDLDGNGLQDGDIILINAAGRLQTAATNAPVGTALAVNDYLEVISAAQNTFQYFSGPYQTGAAIPITVTPVFVRGYGDQWQDPNTDDFSDILTRPTNTLTLHSAYGYIGRGSPKAVNPAWPSAGNLANTNLPNTNGVWYQATLVSLRPLTWDVRATNYDVNGWPANGSTLPNITVNVVAQGPAATVSAAAGVAFTWADFSATLDWSNAGTAPNNFGVGQGQYFIVDEATAAVPAGPGAGNLAGQSVAINSRVYMTRFNPPRWAVYTAGNYPTSGLLIEGAQPVDPTTLSHNRPQTLRPPSPSPVTTVAGLPANASPWELICIEGNWHSVLNDSELPAAGALPNEVYFVSSSARNNNQPSLYSYSGGLWFQLGGSQGGIQAVSRLPAAHNPGDMFLHSPTGTLHISNGSQLFQIGMQPTGPVNAEGIITGRDSGVHSWTPRVWSAGTVVVDQGGLYRAAQQVSSLDPAPSQSLVIVFATFTKIDDWANNLAVDTAFLTASPAGSYAAVGGSVATNISIGSPAYNVDFPANSFVIWTGNSNLNLTLGNGQRIVDGLWICTGSLPATPYTLSASNPVWEWLGHIGTGIYYNNGTGILGAPRPRVQGDLLVGHSGRQDHPRILGVSQDGVHWTEYGGAGKNLPTSYYGATPPANPLKGDLWVDTGTIIPKLKMYNGTSWTESIGAVWHGPAANKPAYNTSEWGDIYIEDDGDRNVWIAASGAWRKIYNGATENVDLPPTDSTGQSRDIPVGSMITLAGVAKANATADTLALIALNKADGSKPTVADFIRNEILDTDYNANGSSKQQAPSNVNGSTPGWWNLNWEKMTSGSMAQVNVTLGIIGGIGSVLAETHYETPNGHRHKSITKLIWNNDAMPLKQFYFSNIQGVEMEWYRIGKVD
jgi:hypothetical protein